jgi:hypothetical protein
MTAEQTSAFFHSVGHTMTAEQTSAFFGYLGTPWLLNNDSTTFLEWWWCAWSAWNKKV